LTDPSLSEQEQANRVEADLIADELSYFTSIVLLQ
jgi:hypothetical protein